jgi:hypothetical protein
MSSHGDQPPKGSELKGCHAHDQYASCVKKRSTMNRRKYDEQEAQYARPKRQQVPRGATTRRTAGTREPIPLKPRNKVAWSLVLQNEAIRRTAGKRCRTIQPNKWLCPPNYTKNSRNKRRRTTQLLRGVGLC